MQAEAGESRGAVAAPGVPDVPAAQATPRVRSRWALPAIIALCLAPVVASYLAYYVFPPAGRVHYGALVAPPVSVADLAVGPHLSPAEAPASFAALQGRWVMVTIAPGACGGDCAQRLYALRQVRLALGRDAERVERVWLVSDNQVPASELLAQHPGLHVWFAPPGPLSERLAPAAPAGRLERIFLVDPRGQLMMQFPPGADPGRIRKDLARLLKISRIG